MATEQQTPDAAADGAAAANAESLTVTDNRTGKTYELPIEDLTVRGGTGWGAEFAKLCNKPLHVFDQEKDRWFTWTGDEWRPRAANDGPVVTHVHFTGTGTRTLQENSRKAIEELFTRSFG